MNKVLKYKKILNTQLAKGFITKKDFKKEIKFIKNHIKKPIVLS